jgi:alpha-glucosidase (family GH31 glycosyl hydrolase)
MSQATMPQTIQARWYPLEKGGFCRFEALSPWLFRVQVSAADPRFARSALTRYGILKTDWAACPVQCNETDGQWELTTEHARLTVSKADGRFTLATADGTPLQQTVTAPQVNPRGGFALTMQCHPSEKLYGLGDENRERLEKSQHKAKLWVRNVKCYAPTPWLMSSGGWALFCSTTGKQFVDLGHTHADQISITSQADHLDLYLFVGDDLPMLLDRGTQLMGRPLLLPRWAYGLTFVCHEQADARTMLDDCQTFRREAIPCDLIGLEPGWMETFYDASPEKQWSKERFHIPRWAATGDNTFIAAARRLGFKLSLWLCCDYDVSEFEEACLKALPKGDDEENEAPSADDFEQDQNIGHPPRYFDRNTRHGQGWFEHLKKFVDQGARAFKMDGAYQVNEHPDRRYLNGMTDEQMHNIYPTLLNKQMSQGMADHLGLRPMIYSSGGYAGIAKYSATWAGDTGGGLKPLISILNHGLSGHSNASCDMDVFTPQGIHFGFLQPWSQVNSWAYWRHPWLLGEKLGPLFKRYAKLRYRLLPYLYTMAHKATTTGMPMMRAMALSYPQMEHADQLLCQYMLGDALLTAAFCEDFTLPEGQWYDYWTGKCCGGNQTFAFEMGDDHGGPLFVKAGSVLPMGPKMQYVGQRDETKIDLRWYPGPTCDSLIYEDDGESFAHETGDFCTTSIQQQPIDGGYRCVVGPRVGTYGGQPQQRTYKLRLCGDQTITSVTVDGKAVDVKTDGKGRVCVSFEEDAVRKLPRVIEVTC